MTAQEHYELMEKRLKHPLTRHTSTERNLTFLK